MNKTNDINYKKAIEELIKLEEESKEKTNFQETYLNQLKRRLKIYEKGRLDALKEVFKWLDNYSKEKGDWHKYYVKIKDLKQQLKQGEKE